MTDKVSTAKRLADDFGNLSFLDGAEGVYWSEETCTAERALMSHIDSLVSEIDSMTSSITELETQLAQAQKELDQKDDALEKLRDWARAYPLSVFPEPDFDRAHELLTAGGITLDAVSASNMRHVITQVVKIIDSAISEDKP